ncbi:MAG: SIS domain-containing protein [Chloroflexi bacterium]|nr:SIS domain-containing protein [Chloroflexota bacterium]
MKSIQEWQQVLDSTEPAVGRLYRALCEIPFLVAAAPELAAAYTLIRESLAQGGTLYLVGNGGSMSDALHISGEMLKSFAIHRPLPGPLQQALRRQPDGEALLGSLQAGLRAHVLGINPTLLSAVANDLPLAGVACAQELLALAKPGDVLLGISTSGKARNIHLALSVAAAIGLKTIALTGRAPNPMSERVDVCIAVPESDTYRVQETHLMLYHQLCLMLETSFFS